VSLTGGLFFTLTLVLLLSTPIATLLLWPRVPGSRWRRLVARLGLLLACQATAVLAVLVSLNDSYGFYASWADLAGTASTQGDALTAIPLAAVQQDWRQPGGQPHLRLLHPTQPFQPYADGFRRTMLRGAASRLRGEVDVWLPPQYHDPAYRNTEFPVLVLLHGIPGAPSDWVELMHVADHLRPAIASGKLPPFIVVVPTIWPQGHDTECSDTPGAKVATWLTQDVRSMVLNNFQATEAPTGWALLGYSTGGFCAAKLPIQHPELFAAGVSLAGDDFAGDPTVLPSPALREHNSPLWLLRHGQTPRIHLLLMGSRQDMADPVAYSEALRAAAHNTTTVVDAYYFHEGGHNQATWERMLPCIFRWLGRHVSPPGAVSV